MCNTINYVKNDKTIHPAMVGFMHEIIGNIKHREDVVLWAEEYHDSAKKLINKKSLVELCTIIHEGVYGYNRIKLTTHQSDLMSKIVLIFNDIMNQHPVDYDKLRELVDEFILTLCLTELESSLERCLIIDELKKYDNKSDEGKQL